MLLVQYLSFEKKILRRRWKYQLVNATYADNLVVVWESYEIHEYTERAKCRDFSFKAGGTYNYPWGL
jgi:hypothetical protein